MRSLEPTARRLSDYTRVKFDVRAWALTLAAREKIGWRHEFGDSGEIELTPKETRRLYEHLADMYGDDVERRLVGVEKPAERIPKSGRDSDFERNNGGADAD